MMKDEKLDQFAQRGVNIAQFASYGPDGKKRHSRIRGTMPTHRFASVEKAIQAILDTGAPFVNIRSFLPNKPDGNPFFMGRKEKWPSITDAADIVRKLCREGYYVIINEDIRVDDGGFSGVIMGDIAEFAPQDTPRCVEKVQHPRCAVLPILVMSKMANIVYGDRVCYPYSRNHRIEFSVHPGPVGYLRAQSVMWQEEAIERGTGPRATPPRWPNRYSEAMGDKAFGLLMAHVYGYNVPYTRVTGRLIPPFAFGEFTGDGNKQWLRTCPRNQQPGKFTTEHGWVDPFALMQHEDPGGSQIAAIIEQNNVSTEGAGYSGAVITTPDGQPIIEGKAGAGDSFMVGDAAPTELPAYVNDKVTQQWEQACKDFGPVRFEWVFDRNNVLWIVQFHCGNSESYGSVVYPGEAKVWQKYDVTAGLEGLRKLVQDASVRRSISYGVILVGNVGVTSHFGDLLRRAKIPSRLERSSTSK